MRRFLRWTAYGLAALLVCLVILALCKDAILCRVAESLVRKQTGLEAKIGSLSVGVVSPTVEIRDLKLYNPEFGTNPILQMPELFLEYDRSAMASNRVHLKIARLNLAEVALMRTTNGHASFDGLQPRKQHSPAQKAGTQAAQSRTVNGHPSSDRPQSVEKLPLAQKASVQAELPKNLPEGVRFDGIDFLTLTLGNIRGGTVGVPENDWVLPLGVTNQTLTNITSEKDLMVRVLLLTKGNNDLMSELWRVLK